MKKIAGEILLYFYTLQRRSGLGSMENLVFTGQNEPLSLTTESKLAKDLLSICDDSAPDLFNALRYLRERDFVSMYHHSPIGAEALNSFVVTANGIDIVEGVERGADDRKRFYVTFNMKLADNINIESLIKNELGSIFKASLI